MRISNNEIEFEDSGWTVSSTSDNRIKVEHDNGEVYYFNDVGELEASSIDVKSVNTDEGRTTRASRADISENNPHDTVIPNGDGAPAWKLHPLLSNPVIDEADVADLSNARFVADPFWRSVGGEIHLFAEIKHDNDGNSTETQNIGYWKGDSPASLSYESGTVLDGEADGADYSYPWFRKIDGEWYLIPSHSGSGVQIYTFDGFDSTPSPTLQETVLTDAANSDPTPFWFNDRWWLITTTNGQATLYYADSGRSITGRTWTEHPISPIGADLTEEGAAGRARVHSHHVEVPIEDQTNTRTKWFRITDLTTTSFSWSEVDTSPILREDQSAVEDTWRRIGMHHIDILSGDWGGQTMAIVDGKDSSNDYSLGVVVPTGTKSGFAKLFKSSSLGGQTMDGSVQTVSWDSVSPDFEGAFDDAANAYVAPTTGWYDVHIRIWFTGQTSTQQAYTRFQRDGSDIRFSQNDKSLDGSNRQSLTNKQTVYLTEGDELTVTAKADNGEINNGRTLFEVSRTTE
jgi:hypothetical protein